MTKDCHPTLSLIIPFYNEAESIADVLNEACSVMSALEVPHEVLAVNDGSSDDTLGQAHVLAKEWPCLKILSFGQNRGQAAALLDGLREARGRVLITMDGDGQNDPSDIPVLLRKLDEANADMVAGIRARRQDSWLRKRMSRLANAVRQKLLNDGVRDSGCALKVMRKEVCDSFIPIRTLYSFMPALAVAAGFKVAQHEVNHRHRKTGISKYGLGVMLWRPLVDMLGVWWFAHRRFQKIAPQEEACSC